MPNWCTGDLKVRGKKEDIVKFLKKELFVLGGNILNREYKEPEVVVGEYSIEVPSSNDGLWFRNLNRTGFNQPIDLYFDEDDGEILTLNLGEIQSAWGTDTKGLTKISKKYNLDFKIYAYEKGMQFNIDYEVHKGEVIKNDEITYDDYVWECTNPDIGG